MSDARPIADTELGGLFSSLLTVPLALAVSGGVDSVALMRLVHRWHRQSGLLATIPDGRAPIIVLSVDHKLRPESTREAGWVEVEARSLGFPCTVLTWDGAKPMSGVQEAARSARYGVMRGYIEREFETPQRAIVTAHHQDDQAETLLMRLARGSGLDGLSAMRRRTDTDGLVILRPLLDVPKSRLVATLEAEGATWLDDPSNASEAFERVRWRNARPALAEMGIETRALALSARRLSRARDALEWATDDLSVRCRLDLNRGAFARLDRAAFDAAPVELRIRLIMRLLSAYGDAAHQPNLAQVEELCTRIDAASCDTSTLSGCVIGAGATSIDVYRELGRDGLREVALDAGAQQTWDGRFKVSIRGCKLGGDVRVGALGEDGWRQIRADAVKPKEMPAGALFSLPAFRSGLDIISVPHLDFSARYRDSASFVATFCWPWRAPSQDASGSASDGVSGQPAR